MNGGRKTPVTGRWITCIWTNSLAKLSSDGWLLVQIVDYRRRYECCIRNLAQGHNKGSVVRRCWQCQRVGFSNASRPYRLNLKMAECFVGQVRCRVSQGHARVLPSNCSQCLRRQWVGDKRRADILFRIICVDLESDSWYERSTSHNRSRIL